MSKFFLPCGPVLSDHVVISGEDAFHISRVLRMKIGDRITVCDSARTDFFCTITEMTPDQVVARIERSEKNNAEPPFRVHLFQAFPKSDKMEGIIQRAVECGVYDVIPMFTERCISRPDHSGIARKIERWQKIAHSAAKQCGRGMIPQIQYPVTFAKAAAEAQKCDLPVLCYEGEDERMLSRIFSDYYRLHAAVPSDIAVMIGPEGGFCDAEVEWIRQKGFLIAGLGKRILRTETASAFFLACASFAFEMAALQIDEMNTMNNLR